MNFNLTPKPFVLIDVKYQGQFIRFTIFERKKNNKNDSSHAKRFTGNFHKHLAYWIHLDLSEKLKFHAKISKSYLLFNQNEANKYFSFHS